jgi:hypothetical protein
MDVPYGQHTDTDIIEAIYLMLVLLIRCIDTILHSICNWVEKSKLIRYLYRSMKAGLIRIGFFPESRRIAYYANVIWDAIKVQSQVDDKTYKSFDMHSRRLLMRFFRANSFNSESDFYFRLLKKK